MKVLKVQWLDGAFIEKATEIEAIALEPVLTTTVGFLVKKDRKRVVLCSTRSESEYWAVVSIPKNCVISEEVLAK